MLNRIADIDQLILLANDLVKKRFRAGFDGMTGEGAVLWLRINREKLSTALLNNRYGPMPITRFFVAKSDGKARRLGRLTAIDTIIQKSILNVLQGKAEQLFLPQSHAYRPGKGVTTALEAYCQAASASRYVASLDIESCFDSIDHVVLRNAVLNLTEDDGLTELIMRFVKAPIYEDGELTQNQSGLPQGAAISPLLSNLYLHPLDVHLNTIGIPFVRYADDVVLFGDSIANLKQIIIQIGVFFEENLHLHINKSKCAIVSCSDKCFLGHRFRKEPSGMLSVTETHPFENINYFWSSKPITRINGIYHIVSDGILRQKDASLLFDGEDRQHAIPVRSTENINIYSNVVIDSNVLRTALHNGVSIQVFDSCTSQYIGTFTPASSLKNEKLLYNQLTVYHDTEKRLALAKDFILAANHHMILNIRYYAKQHENAVYFNALQRIAEQDAKIKACTKYDELLLMEARSKNSYYGCIDAFISSSGYVFDVRSKRPPKNEVNSMISFGNTLLYSWIALEINKSALDIRVGYLHATNRRQNSLNLDIADVFKPLLVDRIVFSLLNRREMKEDCFDRLDHGIVYLSKKGKEKLINAFANKLQTELEVHGEKYSYGDLIREEIIKLVRYLRTGESVRVFRQVR